MQKNKLPLCFSSLTFQSLWLALMFFSAPSFAVIYTVTITTDPVGASTCIFPASCSLRQAITQANTTPGLDNIHFNIPGGGVQTILPTSALPIITSPVFIDGYTQSGAMPASGSPVPAAVILIELSGTNAGSPVNGLTLGLNSVGSTIKGLAINLFQGNPIFITTGNGILILGANSTGHFILGNYIGTDPAGTVDRGNSAAGIADFNGGNSFGDGTPAGRNIMSGNDLYGMRTAGNSIIRGNYIGTNALGSFAIGNTDHGVLLTGNNNQVGCGLYPTACLLDHGNLLSGNLNGIGGGGASFIKGNRIGTDVTGFLSIPNTDDGISLALPGIMSIGCEPEPAGCTAEEGNLISGNVDSGISIHPSGQGIVKANKIGTTVDGLSFLRNDDGVELQSPNNIIGCELATACDPLEGNLISGNNRRGVLSDRVSASNNVIRGNYIGTTINKNAALANRAEGINLIGGSNFIIENLISGNGSFFISSGIFFTGPDQTVQGNKIGTDLLGNFAIPNRLHGIQSESSNNIIGCDLVGSCLPSEGNLISGNNQNGINITVAAATDNIIKGNKIGTTADGIFALSNNLNGIVLGVNNTTVGCHAPPASCTPAEANIIAFNNANGVAVTAGTSNFILSNSIFLNGLLGIDLGNVGVTPNDLTDPDSGPNLLQNFPVLNASTSFQAPDFARVCGTLNSRPNSTYLIQLFSNQTCDPSGFGEGQQFAGELVVATDGAGNADFCLELANPADVPLLEALIFTATASQLTTSEPPLPGEPDGTSEFSPCINATSRNPFINKFFVPKVINIDETSILTFVFFNPAPQDAILTSPFVDKLSRKLEICRVISNSCGGNVTIEDSSIILTGGRIIASSLCRIEIEVSSKHPGTYQNIIAVGDLITNLGSNQQPASATLQVCEDK